MTETQGKVEATKDTVKGLNKKLEPVEVIMTLQCFFLSHYSAVFSSHTSGRFIKVNATAHTQGLECKR